MLNPRLLLIFTDVPDAETLLDMLLNALAHARRPYGLRFALPSQFAPEVEAAQLPQGTLHASDLKFYAAGRDLSGILPLITDETHFLLLRGQFDFAERWDQTLYARFGKIPTKQAVMTALAEGEGSQAQPCLPAFGGAPTEEEVPLAAGLALVNSAAPVKTLLIHPAFLFGLVRFLHNADTVFDTLSIAAYAAGYSVFALDRAPLWPMGDPFPVAWLRKPGPETLPPTVLARFEQLAGISFAKGTVTVRALNGVFGVEDAYPQRLPLQLAVAQRAQTLVRRASPPMPQVVTAFIDLPEALHPPQSYMLRFAWLKALSNLPLTLYAGGEMERHLRASFPNTLAYPDNSLLPRVLLSASITPMQLFRRNKLPLLQRTARTYPSFSHIAWVDIDVLPHPVCPHAPMNFAALMDNRVHLATVAGEPDTSMIMVPRRHLKLLVREVQSVTQLDTDLKRSYAERELIRRLMEKYPDLFTLHPMPHKGLLFLTGLDAQLLAAPLAQALSSLPEPIALPPAAPTQKER